MEERSRHGQYLHLLEDDCYITREARSTIIRTPYNKEHAREPKRAGIFTMFAPAQHVVHNHLLHPAPETQSEEWRQTGVQLDAHCMHCRSGDQ